MKQLISISLLLSPLCLADPGPATRWLIDEPASMLDIGITRLNHTIDSYESLLTKYFKEASGDDSMSEVLGLAFYDFEDDTFHIFFRSFIKQTDAATMSNGENGCRAVLRVAKTSFNPLFGALFVHEGYRSERQPEDLIEKLTERLLYSCSLHHGVSDPSSVLTVEVPATSDRVSVTKDMIND